MASVMIQRTTFEGASEMVKHLGVPLKQVVPHSRAGEAPAGASSAQAVASTHLAIDAGVAGAGAESPTTPTADLEAAFSSETRAKLHALASSSPSWGGSSSNPFYSGFRGTGDAPSGAAIVFPVAVASGAGSDDASNSDTLRSRRSNMTSSKGPVSVLVTRKRSREATFPSAPLPRVHACSHLDVAASDSDSDATPDASSCDEDECDCDGDCDGDCEGTLRAKRSRTTSILASSAGSRRSLRGDSAKPSVRFAATAKAHDGLSPVNLIFDSLIWDYYSKGKIRMAVDVERVVAGRVSLYPALISKFDDLLERVDGSEAERPVLPGGGGSAAKLSQIHVASLRDLRGLVAYTAAIAFGVSPDWADKRLGEEEEEDEEEEAGAGAGAGAESEPVPVGMPSYQDEAAMPYDYYSPCHDDGVTVDVMGCGPDSGVSYTTDTNDFLA